MRLILFPVLTHYVAGLMGARSRASTTAMAESKITQGLLALAEGVDSLRKFETFAASHSHLRLVDPSDGSDNAA